MATPLQLDPTRATSIRRAFGTELVRRYRDFYLGLVKAVEVDDVLGIRTGPTFLLFNAGDGDSVKRLADKAKEIADKTINETTPQGTHWSEKFTRMARRLGLRRAYKDANKQDAGNPVVEHINTEQKVSDTENSKEGQAALGRLIGKTVEHIKAAAQKVISAVVRIAGDVLGKKGATPEQVSEAVKPEVQKQAEAAKVITETETTAAHAEGQLDMLEALNFSEVAVWVEFKTAGDLKVCPLCSGLEGKVMTIEEARGVIPVHPRCRCAFRVLGARTRRRGSALTDATVRGMFKF